MRRLKINDIHAYVAMPPVDYSTNVCAGDFVDGQTMVPGNGAVDVFDLFVLLNNWGDCPAVPGQTTVVSLGDALTAVGLTMSDWDDFEDVMTTSEDEKEKENYNCWMQRYLSGCTTCPPCPDDDPFAN